MLNKLLGKGAGNHPAFYMAGAGSLHCFCQRVEAGSRGHDVIQQHNFHTLQRSVAIKRAMHVLDALLVGQAGLRWRGLDACAGLQVQRDMQLFADDLGNFHGLIETALLQALFVQWHGNDAVCK